MAACARSVLLMTFAAMALAAKNFTLPILLDVEKDAYDSELERLLTQKSLNDRASSVKEFWKKRNRAAELEVEHLFGHAMPLNERELLANEILLLVKYDEYDLGEFLPSNNFFDAKSKIEQSDLFYIIKCMPKGASLHSLLVSSVDLDFMYRLTFEDHLYYTFKNRLQFKFSRSAPGKTWKLLSYERSISNPTYVDDLNNSIRKELNVREFGKLGHWQKLISTLGLYSSLVTYRPNFVKTFTRVLQLLYEDNVMYAEMFYHFEQLYDLDGKVYDGEATLEICGNIIEKFKKTHKYFVGVRFIYIPFKRLNLKQMKLFREEVVKLWKAYPEWIAGFSYGFVTPSTSLSTLIDELVEFPKELKFFSTAGFTLEWGLDSDYNVLNAYALGAHAITEGYAITKHPYLWPEHRRLLVKFDPIFAQILHIVEDLRQHPLAFLIAKDHPVVVGNSAGTCYNVTGLSFNIYEAYLGMTPRFCDLRCLKQFAYNSIVYSSAPEKEKKLLLGIWQKQWNEFIKFILDPNR